MSERDFLHRVNTTLQDSSSENVLSLSETEALIYSFAQSRGLAGFLEEEAIQLVRWAENLRLGNILIDLVCEGCIKIVDLENGEPTFTVTEFGKTVLDNVLLNNIVTNNSYKGADNGPIN